MTVVTCDICGVELEVGKKDERGNDYVDHKYRAEYFELYYEVCYGCHGKIANHVKTLNENAMDSLIKKFPKKVSNA